MDKHSLPPSSDTPQINQTVQGDGNQTIGKMFGGTVIQSLVIYNNAESPIVEHSAMVSLGPNPYKGLLAFQVTDCDRFFGRGTEIQDLWEQFCRLHEDKNKSRLMAIYGPSGSGKSSLARAGLVPKLAKHQLPGRDLARVVVLVPGSDPRWALATLLAQIAMPEDPAPIAKAEEFATMLKQTNTPGVYDGLRRIAQALPEISVKPLIILVDQLEEVFTLCEDVTERSAFIGNLLGAAADCNQYVSVIITLRSDFLGATHTYPQLNQLIEPQGYFVAAMGVEGLREAIAKPAEQAGHSLDPGTVNLLIKQTEGREGALPVLQFALTRIWAGLVEGKTLADMLGARDDGVWNALAKEAQRIYDSLSTEEQDIARRVFLGLVQLGEGAKDTRRRVAVERLVSHRDNLEQVQRVIARFADPGARLITLAADGGIETAEVTHEALFEHWQQLQDWLDDSRSDLRFQRRLDEAAAVWVGNERAEGTLWRSPDLDVLRKFYTESGDELTPLQVAFFQASVYAKEKRERERRRQRLMLASVLGVGLVLTSGASIFALFQLRQAQQQRVEQLAATAEALLRASQPVNATIHAIAAAGLSRSILVKFPKQPQFENLQNNFLDIIRENPERNQVIHEDLVWSVAFSPDGKYIATGSGDNSIRLWDAQTGKPVGAPINGHEQVVISVAFSPDSKRIISGSRDNTVRLWDVSTGQPIGNAFTGHEDYVYSVAFSPDGKRIVSGGGDATLRLWDVGTGQPIGQPFTGHEGSVHSVTFSPDGKYIVSGGWDSTLRLWDSSTGQPIGKPFTGHEAMIQSVAFSPEGKRVVSGSWDYTLRVWDVDTGQVIGEPFKGHEHYVYSVAFSPNGKLIVSGSGDATLRVWDVNTGKPIGKSFSHDNEVISVAFSSDGERIISGSFDKTLRVWDVSTKNPICTIFIEHEDAVLSVGFSPDGKRIISGSGNILQMWSPKTGQPIGKAFIGHEGHVQSVVFSPDSKRIASGSSDNTLRLWDATTGQPISFPFIGHEDTVYSVAFSPDGKRIVSGSGDNTLRLWNPTTGQPITPPFLGHENAVYSVAFSPDRQRIVSGSGDGSLRFWNVSTGQAIGKPLTGSILSIRSVAFSPDGKGIFSGGSTHTNFKTLQLWDAATGQADSQNFTSFIETNSVAFSPDGKRIVSGSSYTNMVLLWNTITGQPIGNPFSAHSDSVNSVAFSPDGKRIVSGSDDKTVRIWDISLEHSLQVACTQLRYHPTLIQPKNDVAKEAKQTCEQYVWNSEKS